MLKNKKIIVRDIGKLSFSDAWQYQEKIFKKELPYSKNLNKDDDHHKKTETENEIPSINNPREKKVITVKLTSDEKIVYSQLGINPLIKLGKQYLTSNHSVLLEENKNEEKEKSLEKNKLSRTKVSNKKANKKTLASNEMEKFELEKSKEDNPENKLSKITTSYEEINISDEIDNSRKKRRRTSANIE